MPPSARFAIVAAVAVVCGTLGAHIADRSSKSGALAALIPGLINKPSPGIDYTATGSIDALTRLDPCTGQRK